jgi:CBS domain-containing protein
MQNPVSEILAGRHSEVHSISPEATVAAAVRLMNEKNIGAVAVTDEGKLVGIFTERDVLRRVIDAGMNAELTPLYEVMTRQLVIIRPTTTVEEALVIVNAKKCRHLPVLEGDELVGMLSIRDLTNWIVDGQEHRIHELVEYITGTYGTQPTLTP